MPTWARPLGLGVLIACGGPNEPGEAYLVGANLPWRNYGHDFGQAWSDDGVATPAGREALEASFDRLVGAEVVRWFVYADGRALDASTLEDVTEDLDVALEIADDRAIQLIPVLFDYLWFDGATLVDEVQLFGRRDLALDAASRDALIAEWVTPLAERYGDDERIFAIELINEPEWAIRGYATLVPEPVSVQEMTGFLEAVAAPWRGRRPLTLGSAVWPAAVDFAAGLDLDVLQVHHYEEDGLPPVEEIAEDRPVLVGEFPSLDEDLDARIETYEAQGYAGALAWSLQADDGATDGDAVADLFTGATLP